MVTISILVSKVVNRFYLKKEVSSLTLFIKVVNSEHNFRPYSNFTLITKRIVVE